jgi:hypothetical protein
VALNLHGLARFTEDLESSSRQSGLRRFRSNILS